MPKPIERGPNRGTRSGRTGGADRWQPVQGARRAELRNEHPIDKFIREYDAELKAEEEKRDLERINREIDAEIAADEAETRALHQRLRDGVPGPRNPHAREARTAAAMPNVEVREGVVYGRGDPSVGWVADNIAVRMEALGSPSLSRSFRPAEARDRLKRYEQELRLELMRGGAEADRIRRCASEQYRRHHGTDLDFTNRDVRAVKTGDYRDGSTGAGSLGSFTPPRYMTEAFAKWRTAHSALASNATPFDLGPSGMKVFIPAMTSAFTMSVQASENAAIATSSPTADYIEADVITIAGSVKASQQLIDRMGPGLSFDIFTAKQAALQAATTLDTQAWTDVVAGATVIGNSNSPSITALWADVAKAKAGIADTEGVRLPLTHVLMPSANAAWFMSQVDEDDRPIWSPSPAATLGRVGDVGSRAEGYSGFDMLGAQMWEDNNGAASAGYSVVLAGDVPDGLWVGTGELVVDIWPEPDATTLSCIVNARQYASVALIYPSAFVAITGPAYPVTPTFTGS